MSVTTWEDERHLKKQKQNNNMQNITKLEMLMWRSSLRPEMKTVQPISGSEIKEMIKVLAVSTGEFC